MCPLLSLPEAPKKRWLIPVLLLPPEHGSTAAVPHYLIAYIIFPRI
jgi:hypothetical protein